MARRAPLVAPLDVDPIDHDDGIPGSETRREAATRLYRALDGILARPGRTQSIVTHGFALTFLVAAWIGMPIGAVGRVSFGGRSGSLTHLSEDDVYGNRAVVVLNDTAHLAGV